MAALRKPIQAPVLTLEQYIDKITLEASYLDNTVNFLKDFLSGFVSKILPSLDKMSAVASTDVVPLSKDESKAVEKLRSIEFTYLRKITFDGPEGFTGDYLLYAKTLSTNVDHLTQIAKQIKEYRTYLGALLSSGDARLSTKDYTNQYKQAASEREARSDLLASFIKRGSYAVSHPIGSVFQRTSDIEAAINEFALITNRLKSLSIKQIKSDVDACADILSTIAVRVKAGDIPHLTPANAKSLSIGAYEMAKNVEYISIAYYTILAGTNGCNRLIDKIMKF